MVNIVKQRRAKVVGKLIGAELIAREFYFHHVQRFVVRCLGSAFGLTMVT